MLDKWAIQKFLYCKLREGKISQSTFRLGVEHLHLSDDVGYHCKPISTQATNTGLDSKQVRRSNAILEKVGVLRMDRVQAQSKGKRWLSNDHWISLPNETKSIRDTYPPTVPNKRDAALPHEYNVSDAGVPNKRDHLSLTEIDGKDSANQAEAAPYVLEKNDNEGDGVATTGGPNDPPPGSDFRHSPPVGTKPFEPVPSSSPSVGFADKDSSFPDYAEEELPSTPSRPDDVPGGTWYFDDATHEWNLVTV